MKLKCPNCKEYFDTISAVTTTIDSFKEKSDLLDWLKDFPKDEKEVENEQAQI